MGRIHYIHYLRGVAIFFIVLIHCTLFFKSDESFGARFLLAFLCEWTAVFLLISGFLFQYLLPKYQPSKFFLSKARNVLAPYLIVSAPAILLYVSGVKSSHTWVDLAWLNAQSVPYRVAFYYLTGAHLGPLWFIPVLLLIFACSPLLARFGRDRRNLLLSVPLCLLVIALTRRPEHDASIPLAFVHFMPVYVIGMCLCAYRDELADWMGRRVNFGLALLVFLVLFVMTIYLDQTMAVFQKIVLFIILCQLMKEVGGEGEKVTLWSELAETSFAIYFLHGYFVGAIRMFYGAGTHGVLVGSALSIATAIAITAVCYLGARVAKSLLSSRSRLLVGA